jgi:hypothetical protein
MNYALQACKPLVLRGIVSLAMISALNNAARDANSNWLGLVVGA